MPTSREGQYIAGQLLRSGTSPAANYGEARGAESAADFIHKVKIATKELNESEVWMRIIVEAEILSESKVVELLDECVQLQKILNASIRTARNSPKK